MRLRTALTIALLAGLVASVVVTLRGGDAAVGDLPPAATDVEAPLPTPSAPPPPSPLPVPSPSPAPPPVPSTRPALQARLESLLASPDLALRDASVAVAVTDGYGRPVVSHRADELVLPASTLKLVTAASALVTYGPDFRFETRVGLTQPLTASGTVIGDLVLVGSGDPVLGTPVYERWIYPARPRTPLEQLADRVVAAGVERITGGVVGDGTVFSGDTVASGWPERYVSDLDARHISGLTVDGGLGYAVDETADPPRVDIEVASDPARLAARELSRLLVERGVTVERGSRSAPAAPEVVETVARIDSPPLRDILQHMVKRSDNQVADTLVQAVAVSRTGTGTWAMGGLSARAALASLGVEGDGLVFRDGSGLSREDRVTARFLADLDAAMAASPHRDDWWSLMAVAGQEGTLRRRLRGTLAEGRFLGKTGTLDDVKAVAGVVLGPGEERYHLAVVANEARGADRTVASVLMDELVLALAEDLQGCRREPLAAPTPAPSPAPRPSPPHVPPYRLVCPGTGEPAT